MVLVNPFKQALREGRRQIGLWQALANPYTAEICAGAGFDWLLFDGEHAPNDIPRLLAQLQAVAPYPSHPIGRLPIGSTDLVKQYLDLGFQSLLIPFVETAEQARTLVRAVRYPPSGVRGIGVGLSRAARWNRVAGYLDGADEQICLIVQIETAAGLANIEEIAGVEGVDAVFLGPADLSAALGYRGQPGHPKMIATIAAASAAVQAQGKPVGTLAMDQAARQRAIEMECLFIAVGTDVALLAGSADQLARSAGCGPTAPVAGGY